MKKAELLRRFFHMTAVVYLVYYLLPKELFPGFYKWYGLIILVTIVFLVEAIRLKKGLLFPGMRDYEKTQISAFAWFAIGMSLALFFFKLQYVVPVVIGMALIDPLIGEIRSRKKKLYPLLPLIFYGLILFICLFFLTNFTLVIILIMTTIGSLIAIYSESWNIARIDDDFLIIMVPLILLSIMDYVLLEL